jgi:hypothetical protein
MSNRNKRKSETNELIDEYYTNIKQDLKEFREMFYWEEFEDYDDDFYDDCF